VLAVRLERTLCGV